MLASTIIIIVSAALFVYWFRYSCVLILNTKTIQSYAADVARSRQLQFLEIQHSLESGGAMAYEDMRAGLRRDYDKISGLLRSGIPQQNEEESDAYVLERAMLGMSFRWLNVQYAVASKFSERVARQALLEMSHIVEHHANAFCGALAAQRG